MFFGPKKHIQDLWNVIDSQKERILILESQLRNLGAQPRQQQEEPEPQHHLARPGIKQTLKGVVVLTLDRQCDQGRLCQC